MKFRCYCVTVMDHWTPMRRFWTLERARRFKEQQHGAGHLFIWDRLHTRWVEIL